MYMNSGETKITILYQADDNVTNTCKSVEFVLNAALISIKHFVLMYLFRLNICNIHILKWLQQNIESSIYNCSKFQFLLIQFIEIISITVYPSLHMHYQVILST